MVYANGDEQPVKINIRGRDEGLIRTDKPIRVCSLIRTRVKIKIQNPEGDRYQYQVNISSGNVRQSLDLS